MAIQIDLDDEDATPSNEPAQEPTQEVQGQVEETQQPAPEQEPTKQEETVPERYRGKTVQELIRMHEEASKILGRQGHELGELRKTHDEFIKAALTKKEPLNSAASTQEAQDDDIEFFANPKEAIRKYLQNDPTIQELRNAKILSSQEAARKAFNEKHPDAREILQDPEFEQWVRASKVRTTLLMQADKNFDMDAGDEVFSTWKALKGVRTQQPAQETESAQRDALRAAMVPTGAGAPPSSDGRKIYRRADLIRLKMTDPDRYLAMEDEIQQAYLEDRVK